MIAQMSMLALIDDLCAYMDDQQQMVRSARTAGMQDGMQSDTWHDLSSGLHDSS